MSTSQQFTTGEDILEMLTPIAKRVTRKYKRGGQGPEVDELVNVGYMAILERGQCLDGEGIEKLAYFAMKEWAVAEVNGLTPSEYKKNYKRLPHFKGQSQETEGDSFLAETIASREENSPADGVCLNDLIEKIPDESDRIIVQAYLQNGCSYARASETIGIDHSAFYLKYRRIISKLKQTPERERRKAEREAERSERAAARERRQAERAEREAARARWQAERAERAAARERRQAERAAAREAERSEREAAREAERSEREAARSERERRKAERERQWAERGEQWQTAAGAALARIKSERQQQEILEAQRRQAERAEREAARARWQAERAADAEKIQAARLKAQKDREQWVRVDAPKLEAERQRARAEREAYADIDFQVAYLLNFRRQTVRSAATAAEEGKTICGIDVKGV